jgi:hypothetical protein
LTIASQERHCEPKKTNWGQSEQLACEAFWQGKQKAEMKKCLLQRQVVPLVAMVQLTQVLLMGLK